MQDYPSEENTWINDCIVIEGQGRETRIFNISIANLMSLASFFICILEIAIYMVCT